MSSDLLVELLQNLDAPQGRYAELERYHTGAQSLAWISPESRKALGNRLSRMASNIPRLAVSSLTERLRIVGFSDPHAWKLFVDSDTDQLAAQVMADALLYSVGYVLVWSKDGRPVASVESPRQCAVLRDPADRSVIAGVKRYRTKTQTHAYVYLPDRIEHHVANTPGAATAGFELVETLDNPLGVVPLVPIDNGGSEVDDLVPLVDALNKLLVDMMTASEAAGKPRRWIAGLELVERERVDADGNPVLDDDDEPVIDLVSPIDDVNTIQTMISEQSDTKFGQLPASDLSGFKEGVQVIISQIAAVSALPAHYLNPLSSSQVPSADGLRASEASLTARAEQKQLLFGRAWELVGRLLIAVDRSADPTTIPLRVTWGSAATRSVAQEADAAVKLFQSGLLSRRATLARLGFTDDEIEAELDAINDDASAARDIAVGTYMRGQRDAA
ncbi:MULTISPECIES: phage portal protein [unclassified Mycolicibacterium]|uniref:phage portal protein n=1 Tax=unclassified Mycolicibacterium TaxID=2636767 RepID=UPI001EE3D7EF|nr:MULTISPECIES: phage portal protein [unclassified Mycolicibacterium]